MAGKDIKTKVINHDIHILDKSITVSERMKDAYIRTKQATPSTDGTESPAADAYDRTIENGRQAGYEAGHIAKVKVRDAIKKNKEKTESTTEEFWQHGHEKPAASSSVSVSENPNVDAAKRRQAVSDGRKRQQVKKQIEKGSISSSNYRIKTTDRYRENLPKDIAQKPKQEIRGKESMVSKSLRKIKGNHGKMINKGLGNSTMAAKDAQIAAKKTADAVGKAKASIQKTKQAAQTAKKTGTAAVNASRKAILAMIHGVKNLFALILAGGWISVVVVLIMVLFGAAFYFFGDTSSNTYTPVSAEVEAYTPTIQKYAKQYGVEEYVLLIKAVMMQESGGRGNDPMQSSEEPFNTRYPNTPNGITDPDYSIQCGVQELKSCLVEAKCENPVDMDHIRLALQGYNYGNGYISWAVRKDGGYTVANAAQFSDEQAQKHGWSNYGDKQYVAHVLRYYPYGHYNYGVGNEVIVQSALKEVGQVGGQPYWSWYGFNGRVAWCACFVSWNAEQCGYIASGTIPKFSYCQTGADEFKKRGQWQNRNYEPSAGDIIFFDWEQDGHTDHVGIVEKCEGGTVYTVEGNSGDAVRQNTYPVGYSLIYGYGVPAY